MDSYGVTVVGASIAGLSAAEELRRGGFTGSILLVDAQRHLPYDKPPLSKKSLADGWEPTQAQLRPASHYEVLDVELALGDGARALDPAARTVSLESGRTITAQHVVIATGARARSLPGVHSERVLTLRGVDDASAMRRLLVPGARLLVVGGGFVGAEVAAMASQHGVEVTIVEAAPSPFFGVLGEQVGHALGEAHRRRGVRIEAGVAVRAVHEEDAGVCVELADDRRMAADVVLVGLGTAPNIEWLAGSGLALGDGVQCDRSGRSSVSGVYAAGDVACWAGPHGRAGMRGQHWTLAREQGSAVAKLILGRPDEAPLSAAPYFWSDQFDLRLQSFGHLAGHDACELVWGSYAEEKFVVRYYRAGRLCAAVGVNGARELRTHRAELEQGVSGAQ